jgi:hypothetical protein
MLILTDSYANQAPTETVSSYLTEHKFYARPLVASITVAFFLLNEISLNTKIMRLLDEYATLKENWDEDDAKAPFKDAIIQAKYITSLLSKHGQSIYHAAPGPNGEVMLDIRNKMNTKSIEIVFYHERSVVVTFPENHKPSQFQFEDSALPGLLEWLNHK